MYTVKFDLLLILVLMPSTSYVLTETLQNVLTFSHFSLGGGVRGVKKQT